MKLIEKLAKHFDHSSRPIHPDKIEQRKPIWHESRGQPGEARAGK